MSVENDAKNKAIDDEAAALVAAVAPAAVAALIARYPEAEHVGIRSNWYDLDPHSSRRVPLASTARAEYLTKLIDSNQAELQRDIVRYNDGGKPERSFGIAWAARGKTPVVNRRATPKHQRRLSHQNQSAFPGHRARRKVRREECREQGREQGREQDLPDRETRELCCTCTGAA